MADFDTKMAWCGVILSKVRAHAHHRYLNAHYPQAYLISHPPHQLQYDTNNHSHHTNSHAPPLHLLTQTQTHFQKITIHVGINTNIFRAFQNPLYVGIRPLFLGIDIKKSAWVVDGLLRPLIVSTAIELHNALTAPP